MILALSYCIVLLLKECYRMHRPLEGIRILEWAIHYAGPGATGILRDMGAEVIKIEKPVTGDPFRHPKLGSLEIEGNTGILFEGTNRGKKSITLDLSYADGKKIAYDLVSQVDVFFTNVRTSTINTMQMDYSTLVKINPTLIYARVNAYGIRGPDADKGGFDQQGQARAGMMYSHGGSEPTPILGGIVDHSTAIMASYQTVLAILMRERFGIAQEVDVSLLGTASYLMYLSNLAFLFDDKYTENMRMNPLRHHYRCRDGKWLILRIKDSDWAEVCELIGCSSPENDQKFNDMVDGLANAPELLSIFRQAFSSKPRSEWLRLFYDRNLAIAPVNTPEEAFNDPQMMENGYVVNFKHPDMGNIKIPGFPIHLSKGEITSTMGAPKLGEDTDGILHDMLSYSQEEIAELRARGVI
jgi:crotonobetainyl-CoA:carnitine CoA-transferase CaiB-like acyl-CoA transferase